MSIEGSRAPNTGAPPRPVALRDGAVTDLGMLRVTGDAAVKANAFPSTPGHASGMSNLRTRLRVDAWVRNASYAKSVWLDAHVFARDDVLLHAETLALRFTQVAGDGGAVFVFDGPLYQGSVATQGSVDPRPDARSVQYRLYCEQDSRVFTDGIAHWCALREDAASG